MSRIASSIHLGSLAGRKIKFVAPVTTDLLHGGAKASLRLRWSGGAIPAGVEFVATWRSIELDSEVIAARTVLLTTVEPGATDPGAADLMEMSASRATTASPSPIEVPIVAVPRRNVSVTVPARTVRSKGRSITLSVVAPPEPGRYVLDVQLRDAGRTSLPARERIHIPGVEVRVFDDRSVTYDLDPSPDGAGVVVRITNTGLVTIPADPGLAPFSSGAKTEAVRSLVTVAASASASTGLDGVRLVASPLVDDLVPGASISFTVPDVEALTGRTTNWISASLSVVGNADWLGASSSIGGWLATAGADATVTPTPMPSPTATATPSPTPIPTTTPMATPKPTARRRAQANRQADRQAHGEAEDEAGRQDLLGAQRQDHVPRWLGQRPGSRLPRRQRRVVHQPGRDRDLQLHRHIGALDRSAGSDPGLALVLIDGRAVARVNLWRSSYVAQAVLFQRTFRNTGRHKLTIKVLSSSGHPYVAIDGFTVRS